MPLCDFCVAINAFQLCKPGGQLHSSIRHIKVSAKTCEFCALLLKECDSVGDGETTRLVGKSSREVKQDNPEAFDRCVLWGIDVYPADSNVPYLGRQEQLGRNVLVEKPSDAPVGHVRLHALEGTAAATSGDIVGRRVESADDTERIMKWFERCRSTHEHCAGTRVGGKTALPTRVVDVSRINRGGEPFLLETQGLCGDYISLSHRWGSAHITMTTKDNFSAHKTAIPWIGLCKTFQDAMTVTNKLGYQFLWIDSLCIIQDNAEDWKEQATRMADIYKCAAITIAAACATSGDTGLFHPRESLVELEIPYYTKDGVQDGYYVATDLKVKEFSNEVVDGPLNTRAWTLQERHLSTRILHYGRTQLFWECQSTIWEESSDLARSNYFSDRFEESDKVVGGYLKSLSSRAWDNLNPLADRPVAVATAFSTWYSLVSQYSRRFLTFGDDKLPAISGLAREFGSHRNDIYIAGLWKGDLPVSLLWNCGLSGDLHRATPFRAPSWSWAAWDGPISFESAWDGAIDVENIQADVDLLDLDSFGKVRSGEIRLAGFLKPVRTTLSDSVSAGRGWAYANAEVFNDNGVCVGCACIDEPHLSLNKSLFALSIFRVFVGFRPFSMKVLEARGNWTWCLLLESSGSVGTFQRAGLAQVDQEFFNSISARQEVSII